MEQLIRAALDQERVGLAFQPIVDLADGRVVALEALLRLRDAHGDTAPAYRVVQAAERAGQIPALGRCVLATAAHQAAAWWAEVGVLVPVAVNVSALQVHEPDFVDDVLAALAEAGLPPAGLSLELTESVLLDTDPQPLARLEALHEQGVELALDDFGTGFDSLRYLHRLPASALKVDRSFVSGIPGDARATAIVDGVVGLAHRCGLSAIAEGIETHAQLQQVAALGALGQGYLLARPSSADEVTGWLARGALPGWPAPAGRHAGPHAGPHAGRQEGA